MRASNYNLIRKYLTFANAAGSILSIKTEEDYQDALKLLEELLKKTKDTKTDPLNGLIDLISQAIESYEQSKPEIKKFIKKLSREKNDTAVLRLLMDQHNLGVADFPELGDKSLISKILSGERNLTKNHIQKLSQRFCIDPNLFF